MKNILISFIRNNHIELQNEDNYNDLDITTVVRNSSIDRLFLLTNKNREESIGFKIWIADKLNIEVKAVTLEKGSEKYILNKIESIIKYILLAEEGHATFFYLPGENTLQINLWEIVNKNIYNGKILYPNDLKNNQEEQGSKKSEIPVYNDLKDKKIFTVKTPIAPHPISLIEKGVKSIKSGSNLLLCGEEGTGKQVLALKILKKIPKKVFHINFRTINPLNIEIEFEKIVTLLMNNQYELFLFLNVEVLPHYIQEKFTEFKNIQIISTLNIKDNSSIDELNKKFYYLISSFIITLAPLRYRKNEFEQIIAELLKDNKSEAVISDNAFNYLKNHNWPGNFNELKSVISRASIETNSVITLEIIERSLDQLKNELNQWRNVPIDENFKLNDVIGDVAMYYIMLALEMSEGKKSKAAGLLGFSNYQTLSNWINKYKK